MSKALTLYVMFLFLFLIVGTVIIFGEEIVKTEFLGRTQTTPVSNVDFANERVISSPVGLSANPSSVSVRASFNQPRGINQGNGRAVNDVLREFRNVEVGETAHIITSGVSDVFARGFIEESANRYDPSTYAGLIVFLDRTSGIKEEDPNEEYFVLLVSNLIAEPIDITGWKIFDRERRVAYKIPESKRLSTSSTDATNTLVSAGDRIIISSGRSPIGRSFRVNKCSGYREQFKSFVPSLKTDCFDPVEELEVSDVPFSDLTCYDETRRINSCETLTEIPRGVTRECRTFFTNTLSLDGCVKNHRNDNDFYQQELRLYLNSSTELWANRDNLLYLLDGNDNLVSTLVYR